VLTHSPGATGRKASKWAGATGPQNVFFRNYMQKQLTKDGPYTNWNTYELGDSEFDTMWQYGWGSLALRYQHLTLDGSTPLDDWAGHENVQYNVHPAAGVNSGRSDSFDSLFLESVSSVGLGSWYNSVTGCASSAARPRLFS
jgi:hypothetical protein